MNFVLLGHVANLNPEPSSRSSPAIILNQQSTSAFITLAADHATAVLEISPGVASATQQMGDQTRTECDRVAPN